jgi:hypothetical protein
MPRKQPPPPTFPIALVFEGKAYSGSFSVESQVITVRSEYGSDSTSVDGESHHETAERVFRELLTRAKGRGEL